MSDEWQEKSVLRPIDIQLGENEAWVPDEVCPKCKKGHHDFLRGIHLILTGSGWVCSVCGHRQDDWSQRLLKPDASGFITVQAHINGALASNPYLSPTGRRFALPDEREENDVWLEAGFNDLGNAKRLVMDHGDKFRWVSDFRSFLVYDGFRWVLDKTHAIERYAKLTIGALFAAAVEKGATTDEGKRLLRHAEATSSKGRMEAMIQLTRSDPHVAMTPDAFDAIPHLISTKTGTVDLTTGLFQTPDPLEYSTKLSPVVFDADAPCPMWDDFILNTIAHGDDELAQWLQKAVGYSFTGSNAEQCFFFMYGDGANGKSKFLEVLSKILGDYATATSFDLFLKGSRDNVEHGLAALRGVRLATAIEAPSGRGWNEALLKGITGGDRIRASLKYQNAFEFTPHVKLWFAANTRPVVQGRDNGIWRRFIPIPCMAHIAKEDQDGRLAEKLLEQESRGILAWAIRGAVRWHQEAGLHPLPAIITDALKDYQDTNDVFGRFFEERCARDDYSSEAASVILKEYNEWAKQTGERTLTHNSLSETLSTFRGGFLRRERDTKTGRQVWFGLKITLDDEAEPGLDSFQITPGSDYKQL